MTSPISTRRPMNASQGRPSEEGYVLLAVIFLLALLTISLAIAMPKVAKEIQRDRELETMQRGKQYARAVRMYYKKFGAYPPNVDALVKPPTISASCARSTSTHHRHGRTGSRALWQEQSSHGDGLLRPAARRRRRLRRNQPARHKFRVGYLAFIVLRQHTWLDDRRDSELFRNRRGRGDSNRHRSTSSTDPNSANTTTSAFGQTGQTFGGAGIIGFSPNSPSSPSWSTRRRTTTTSGSLCTIPMST